MSSAILYLAIVAIWACVLIPRWLKRDSVRGAAAAAERPAAHLDGPADPDGHASHPDVTLLDDPDAVADIDHQNAPAEADANDDLPPHRVPEPLSQEELRRRMLTARRRLLVMLIALEVAAIALAVVGLAAVWVIVPPSLMLAGYVLLLREAAAADRERAGHEAEAEARRRARESARMRARSARNAVPASAGASTAEELAAKFAAAPVAADYEDAGYADAGYDDAGYDNTVPGRDFAPGLAGKYTTSQAEAERADEEYYEPPRLRAVGD